MTESSSRILSFEAVAAEYDRTRLIPTPVLEDVARACVREAKLTEGGLFLDAGVGTGRFTSPIARWYPGQAVGLDISTAMMAQARSKAPADAVHFVQGDLQRLPFQEAVFKAALVVHILHLMERWRWVLDELRRVLSPQDGVLLLGGEQGGHSILIDYYYEQARVRGVLGQSLGPPGLAQALTYLRQDSRAQVTLLSHNSLQWKRRAAVADTLDALSRRTYSLMWNVPDKAHQELMAETRHHAALKLGPPPMSETVESRFVLHAIRWA